jgi:signal transduction histidine kinase
MASPTVFFYVVLVKALPGVQLSRPLLVDIALAIAAAAAMITGTVRFAASADRALDWLGVTLLLASAASLVVRRSWATATLVATAVLAVTYNALDYPLPFWTIPLAIALYTAVADGRRVAALAITGAAFAALMATGAFFRVGHFADATGVLWFTGWLTASFVAGEVSRARNAYLKEVENRAVEAERTRDEEARRRASEERMQIARELHDVLAHSISVINVQAGVALHLLDRQPEQARPALVAITQASRDALRELRATLGVLRSAQDEESRAPAPTLARLDDLVRQASAAGAQVSVSVTGAERALAPGIDLAAYRIAQESLTNVARHARPATATLSIDYGTEALVVEVKDDGRAVPDERAMRAGHGLIGMRERAASLGGELDAGPRPEGGFRVRARLPLNGTT